MAAPGMLDGVRAFTGAVGFVAGRTRNWALACVPIAVFVSLAGGVAGLGFLLARGRLPGLLGLAPDGVLATVVTVLGTVAAGLAGVVVGLALAQPLSGPALETLCRRQEAALGASPLPEVSWHLAVLRSALGAVAGVVVAALVLVPLTVVGWIFPPAGVVTVPLKVVATALFVAWDLLDTPMSLRAMPLRDRWRWVRAHGRACLGFGLVASAVLLLPIVGLVALPAGAVGASRLMVRSESRDP